jgi:hypothetical protein
MIVRYVGPNPLPYRIDTPIPYTSRSEHEGTLEFNPECDVKNSQWAWFLLKECGDAFERVETRTATPKPGVHLDDEQRAARRKELIEKATGRRFMGKAGKWNAFAYLKKHKLEAELGLKKLQIGDKVLHWELVPVTLADVGAKDAPIPWNKPTKDAQEVVNESVSG